MRSYGSVLCILTLLHTSQGLRCYTCNMNGGETDRSCEKDPENVITSTPVTDCSMKYCTIRRQEILTTGEIYTFHRSCESNPSIKNGVVEDSVFKTYFQSCTTDKCNFGDGKTGGVAGGGNGGDGIVWMVPGLPNSSPGRFMQNNFTFLLIVSVVNIYLHIPLIFRG